MASAFEYNLIKLKSLYLTAGNSGSGDKYISIVTGLERFQLSKSGRTLLNASGKPINQFCTAHGLIEIEFNWFLVSDLTSVKAIFEQYITDKQAFDLEVTGKFGTFAGGTKFSVKPNFPDPLTFSGEAVTDRIEKFKISVRTT